MNTKIPWDIILLALYQIAVVLGTVWLCTHFNNCICRYMTKESIHK